MLREGGTYTPTLGRSLSLRLGQSYQGGGDPGVYQDSTSTHNAAPRHLGGDPEGARGNQQGSSNLWGFMDPAPTAAGTPAAYPDASQGQQQGSGLRADQEDLGTADMDDLGEPLSWGRWPAGARHGQPRRHQRVITDDLDTGTDVEGGPGGFGAHQRAGTGQVEAERGRGGEGVEDGALRGSGVPQEGQGQGRNVEMDGNGWVSVRRSPSPLQASGAPQAEGGGTTGGAGEAGGSAPVSGGGGTGTTGGERRGEEGPVFDLEDPDIALDAMLMIDSRGATGGGGGVAGFKGVGGASGHGGVSGADGGAEGRRPGGGGEGGGAEGGEGLEAHLPGSRGRTPSLNWDDREAALILTAEDMDDLGEPLAANGHAVGGAGGQFGEEEDAFWLPSDANGNGPFGQQRNWLQAHQTEHV